MNAEKFSPVRGTQRKKELEREETAGKSRGTGDFVLF